MAVSGIFMLPVIVLFFFAQKAFIEGVNLTGSRDSTVARVALFGSGWIMARHARGLLRIRGPSWWRRRTGGRSRWPRWPSSSASRGRPPTGAELAADPSIDAVVIGTPNALHAPQAIACLAAGKHVLVEKPMATTLAEAEAMCRAAAAPTAA